MLKKFWNFKRSMQWVAGLLLILFAALIWLASSQLVHPTRRKLQDYHFDWLNGPEKHGISILRLDCLDGKVPCLVVFPDAGAGPGERGVVLRKQLTDMGDSLIPFGSVQATLVMLHGRNGRKEDLLPIAERFCAVGFRCLLPDLPAHGESPLKKMEFATDEFEANLASAVLKEASNALSFSDQPAAIWGMSMGGAFAVRSASRDPSPWQAIVVVCSFDQLDAVVCDKLSRWTGPLAPPLEKLVGQVTKMRGGASPADSRPVDWAARIKIPALVVHGDKDALISPNRGKTLFEAFSSKDKKWIVVPSGDHDNILITPMPLYAAMADWLLDSAHTYQAQTP